MVNNEKRFRASQLLVDVDFEMSGEDVEVTGVANNSQKVKSGDLFFCVVGFKSDGHDYATDAVARGCAGLVVQRKLDLDVPQFIVEDTRSALALAAARFFDVPSEKMDVVGVTGTNGKTTTTYLVDWVARSMGLLTGVIGTVETRILDRKIHADHTTPESIDLQELFSEMVDAGCREVAMEVSSHAIDLRRILGTKFSVVAFSNLTQDHLDYHKTMENYFQAKAALFSPEYSDKAAICIDGDYGKRLVEIARDRGLNVITAGFDPDADVSVSEVSYQVTHTELKVKCPSGEFTFDYPLIGRFNVENVVLAIAICHQLGYDDEKVCSILENAPQVPGRLERVAAEGMTPRETHDKLGFSVYVDYAHTPDAIENAIAALRPITDGRLIIVFGCGGDRDRTKRPKMGAAACAADYIFVTSDNPRTEDPQAIIDDIIPGLAEGEGRYEVIPDRREAIGAAVRYAAPGDSVLVAGKGHEDYQLVGDKVLSFDDRVVSSEELGKLLGGE
ncbi:MAG: UDP-N-acetylmuramoyl-L-alanyl-D-glutamate--2,6-diaminopimelate ligase [Coriobacteriales bacterium]|jgi:UDP-N-acetylmuramoyl-L-alanyl-D-glutamate--2,6-diaminopimelate ligase